MKNIFLEILPFWIRYKHDEGLFHLAGEVVQLLCSGQHDYERWGWRRWASTGAVSWWGGSVAGQHWVIDDKC